MKLLDAQVAEFAAEIKDALGLDGEVVRRLITTVGAELRFLPPDAKTEILAATPVDISARLAEVVAFQSFMDQIRATRSPHPATIRAQVVYQNYVCFIYLGESLFRVLAKSAPSGSVSRKCARFLTDNPVRAFRNSLAHSNWKYREDFTGLVFWARTGTDPAEPMSEFQVVQRTLNLWQTMSRGIAYAAYQHLRVGTG